jgi:hypothetical protein
MKSVFSLSLVVIANELCVTFSVGIDHNLPPDYIRNISYMSSVMNIEVVQNFELIFDKFYIGKIYT